MHRIIELFVMQGCHVCPEMERTFHDLKQKGEISELKVFDVSEHPHLAQQYNIRSVPYYLINGIAFTGLKSQSEILRLLQSEGGRSIQLWITEQLADGQLAEVETGVVQQPEVREAVMQLLEDIDTPLMVRIGLSAVIESLAEHGVFADFEPRFIELANHPQEQIAIDAIYYLQLLSTPSTLSKLAEIAQSGRPELQQQAEELLLESSAKAVKH
jgi:thioredoxin-like negative regulator of GroEL